MKKGQTIKREYLFHLLFPIFIVFLLFPFLAGIYPIVRFTEEEIDIFVHKNHIEMKGIYFYSNPFPFPVIQGMSVPLPIDSGHPHPVNLRAIEISPESKAIPIRFFLGKHRFDLKFKPKEEVKILIQYYQYSPKRNAHYILTTTKPWKHPLDRGMYRLFPEDVNIISSNYTLKRDVSDFLFFGQTNFMPKSDWHFSWEVK
jgi:hypothetical protein